MPVSGSLVQRDDHLGFRAAQFAKQELPEEGVVAVPLSPTVERDHEQAAGLQAAQLPRRIRGPEDGIADRTRKLIEYSRAPQEPLNVPRLPGQGLAVQV